MQNQGAATDPDDPPAFEVTLTPRDYRRRAVVAIAVGAALLVATVLGDVLLDRSASPGLPLLLLGYGIYCARQTRHQITATLLRIDRQGIHAGQGAYERTWDDVIMVWIGSQTGLRLPFVIQPVLSIFTRAGIDFARRAGTRPSALYTLPIGGRHRIQDLCRQLGRLTSAEVIDGSVTSRRRAADALGQRR